MKNNPTYKLMILCTVLVCISLLAWSAERIYFKNPVQMPLNIVKSKPAAQISYDPVVFANYERIFLKYDTIRENCTMEGVMNIIDKADTSNNMKDISFLFSKAGKDFYYKLGSTETINAGGLYIFIDHKSQTILLSAQKTVNYDPQPDFLANLGQSMKTEGYEMKEDFKDNNGTITLENEHNINCKQFSITYDTAGMQITRLYARMTNLQYPMNRDKEKIVNISLSAWNSEAEPFKYFNEKEMLKKVNGKWKTIGDFTNYELTVIE